MVSFQYFGVGQPARVGLREASRTKMGPSPRTQGGQPFKDAKIKSNAIRAFVSFVPFVIQKLLDW